MNFTLTVLYEKFFNFYIDSVFIFTCTRLLNKLSNYSLDRPTISTKFLWGSVTFSLTTFSDDLIYVLVNYRISSYFDIGIRKNDLFNKHKETLFLDVQLYIELCQTQD